MIALNPTAGPASGGTTVVIIGTSFSGAAQVHFGSVPATSFVVDSATRITAVAPSGSAGTVDVTVTTAYGTSAIVDADRYQCRTVDRRRT